MLRAVVVQLKLSHKRQATHMGNIHLKRWNCGSLVVFEYTFKFVDLHLSLLQSSHMSAQQKSIERGLFMKDNILFLSVHL